MEVDRVLCAIAFTDIAAERSVSVAEVEADARRYLAAEPARRPSAPKSTGFHDARGRVGADLRRIALSTAQLAVVTRLSVRRGVRRALATGEDAVERVVVDAARRALHMAASPLVYSLLRVAGKVDGGPVPATARMEEILATAYGADRSRWPAWAREE